MKRLTITIIGLMLTTPVLGKIQCHTPQELKGFTLTKDSIVLEEKGSQFNLKAKDRYLSSVESPEQVSINKIFDFEGKNYRLFIKNVYNFSDVDDFVSIKSSNGHEITYPLNCH